MRYVMFISQLGYNQGAECVKACFSLTYIFAPFDLANQVRLQDVRVVVHTIVWDI